MTVSNLYITRANFLNWQRSTAIDTVDDAVIDQIIEQTSRLIDYVTGRKFYPQYKTNVYDIPSLNDFERDTLYLNDTLLSLTSLANGDGTTISAPNYILKDAGKTPYWAIKLRDTSTVTWQSNASGSAEQVLGVAGVWGWHKNYPYAWVQAGTLGAAITDASGLTATATAGHTLASQQIWRIDSEVLQGTVSANTLTFNFRGDNGSTTATHLINAPIYAWIFDPVAASASQIIVDYYYQTRFGTNRLSAATITPSGIVLTPSNIPADAWRILSPVMRQS